MSALSPHLRPVRLLRLLALFTFHFSLFTSPARAISVGSAEKDTSPEAELASFTVQDGFAVNLFASEKDGVTNPISIRWDERGRLWVLTTTSYPQPEPGAEVNDKILILEDTDHDGKADKTTVFADKLRMPMGLELAPGPAGAAYIGEGEKLWLMRDTDGDSVADVREVVFSGFGTGDTHQSINSFTWTPDGALMFSQGLHCYSNVTTAWGGKRLYGAGFWLYRPLSGKLTPYPTGFPLNAWGTVYDDAGQPFSVAGAAGMFWTTPLLISTEHLIEGRALPNNGQIVKQGMLKYCGVDIPRNAHWPADMHGELVSGGFFENCIYRHKLQDDKANPSGYEAVRQPDLLKSRSVSFRPVDVKFGPEGALYISDWFDPIIGHYQASFRHPERDKKHGRIWRVVRKGAELVQMKDLSKADVKELHTLELVNAWITGDRWEQYQAQRLLMAQPQTEVATAITMQIAEAAAKESAALPTVQLRAYQSLEMFEHPNEKGLNTALLSKNAALRAYAVGTIGLWQDRIENALGWLAKFIADENPRVRLEAIVACAHIPKADSIGVALRALDQPRDSFIDRALELAIHALAPQWEPALQQGRLKLPPKHLAYLLEKKSGPESLARIREMLHDKAATFDAETRRVLLLLLAKQGTSEDVALALSEGTKDATLLSQLADLVEAQQIKAPQKGEKLVSSLFEKPSPEALAASPARNETSLLLSASAKLIGLWKLTALAPQLKMHLTSSDTSLEPKRAILIALARLDAERDLILKLSADAQQPWLVRLGAVEALCEKDSVNAAKSALALMPTAKTEDEMRALLAPFLAKGGRLKNLVTQLDAAPCTKESADLATRTLLGIGRNEPELTAVLNRILGRITPVQPFDAQWVSSLANDATISGNAKRGGEIFQRVTLNCIACHAIGGKGGIIGPQLDAVGRGVPTELLIEAVMWPQRQIKEGYTATTIVMKDGRTMMGYKVAEGAADLQLRDMATQQVSTLPKSGIQTRTDAGSLMPEGLTASLSREELRDLIAYLASLGK